LIAPPSSLINCHFSYQSIIHYMPFSLPFISDVKLRVGIRGNVSMSTVSNPDQDGQKRWQAPISDLFLCILFSS
jgi:hypothetical protein